MITGLIVFAVVTVILLWVFTFLTLFLEDQNALGAAVLFGGLLVTSLALGWAYEHKRPPTPCVKWETTMQFNPATKTMTPVKYCAQHGEWVENE